MSNFDELEKAVIRFVHQKKGGNVGILVLEKDLPWWKLPQPVESRTMMLRILAIDISAYASIIVVMELEVVPKIPLMSSES